MKIVKKNKTYFLNFDKDTESKDIDNYVNKQLEIKIINSQTIAFSVIDKTPVDKTQLVSKNATQQPAETNKEQIKNKIIKILLDKNFPFQDKVEGKFETLLKPEDLLVFKEMLKNKEVITYKQSEKYKKAIYVVNQGKPAISVSTTTSAKTAVDENAEAILKEFLKKKFALIKSITTADKFTKEFYSKFKNNEIKGQKSFDGNFYVIDVYLYNNIRKQILSSGLDKNFSIEDLSKKLNKEIDLLKIAIEFLKEEGVIIEKRKNIYCLV
ncbi:MAG TPA: hypothetical protein P5530_01840 [Candidatus Diapherotrites archaeon]|nr:hypothetical protein [Candidatus Diapherotrites archaeon]